MVDLYEKYNQYIVPKEQADWTGLKLQVKYVDFVSFLNSSVSEFNEFEPRLKSAKNRFQLSAGLNLEKLYTLLSGNNHI